MKIYLQSFLQLKLPPPELSLTSILKFEATCIGSTLGAFIMPNNLENNMDLRQAIDASPAMKVWGSGFLTDPMQIENTFLRKLDVYALRGKRSKERLENITRVHLRDIALADPGILAAKLIKKQEKRYCFGIIPHHTETYLPIFQEISKLQNCIVIDVHNDVLEILKQIAQCEMIVSSALHGLIVADSFGIPNIRLVATDTMRIAQNFKFFDYYSAYDIEEHSALNIHTLFTYLSNPKSLKDIISNTYHIKPEMIKNKQRQLLDCCPFKLF